MTTYRLFKCTDGFVTKTIAAETARDAAEKYAIVTSDVRVTELDDSGNEIGETEEIAIQIAE